jgi:hypothetical protein
MSCVHMRRDTHMFDGDGQEAFKFRELVPFVTALFMGAAGGCVSWVYSRRTSRELIVAYISAFAITGAFGAVMAVSIASIFLPIWVANWHELVLFSGAAGIITASSVAAGNLTMKFVLRHLGIEMEINVRRSDDK